MLRKTFKNGIKTLLVTFLRIRRRSWRSLKRFRIGFKLIDMKLFLGMKKVLNWPRFMILSPKRRYIGGNILEKPF